MVESKLSVYQIYYSPDTAKNCFKESSWWHHWDNSNRLSPYFENSVIKEIITSGHANASEYVGIFSHAIGSKMVFKGINGKHFSPEGLLDIIENNDADFYSFQKRRTQPNIITQAENYHPGIVDMTTKILQSIGYDLPKRLDKIVLFNHFVARRSVYEKYVEEMLVPAMDFMATMPELNKDAGYKETTPAGMDFYPYHPFILERLPSVWLQYNSQLNFMQCY